MNVLIDANIIVTFLTRRDDPFLQKTDKIFQLCYEGRFSGYVALQTVPIVWYVLRKLPHQARRNKLKSICNLLKLAVTDMESIQQALANNFFTDFEDNLQDCCAQSIGADYIVTANVRDYNGHSVVKAVTPSEFLDILNESDTTFQMEVHEQHVEYNAHCCHLPFHPHYHIIIT
ncbi:MAG: PIN domain-containing protein, partial [Victivallales bacterium]|nr:PIN domain-containing protein [Victivallales bacterium]